ncbi:hypothetical protein D3C73_1473900 [compost metagenome]
MPWSIALRMRWISGSDKASTRVLSSVVSSPLNSSRICLPDWRAMSLTNRLNLVNTWDTGSMRISTMASCSSFVMRSSIAYRSFRSLASATV